MSSATKHAVPTKSAGAAAEELPWGFDRRSTGSGARAVRPRQVLVYPCRAEGLGRPIRASLTDASSDGLGLVCLGSLAVGSRFVLRMDQPGGPPQLQVYHVVRCRNAGGGACLIGATFDEVFTGACPLPVTSAAASAAC